MKVFNLLPGKLNYAFTLYILNTCIHKIYFIDTDVTTDLNIKAYIKI